jgi:hypothetical protein
MSVQNLIILLTPYARLSICITPCFIAAYYPNWCLINFTWQIQESIIYILRAPHIAVIAEYNQIQLTNKAMFYCSSTELKNLATVGFHPCLS